LKQKIANFGCVLKQKNANFGCVLKQIVEKYLRNSKIFSNFAPKNKINLCFSEK
jgi:AAA+ superfamily predicted ATPase